MEIFVNRAREADEEKQPEIKTTAALQSQVAARNTYGKSNNSLHSVMNSFLEETMLKKMGSTLGDLDESNFY